VKGKQVFLLILLIVIADQALKIWVKTSFYMWEERRVIGEWFRLHFIENEGMAWGWQLGEGGFGKIALTLFRLVAVGFGVYYIRRIIKEKYHTGFIVCAALIFAGALGNLIDSMFYGMIFENSDPYTRNLAQIFPDKGYAGFLHGKVVDMFYFPIIRDAHFPSWVPVWGGEEFEFFRPVFNLADASISVGVIAIIIFQKKFLKKKEEITETVPAPTPLQDQA
jgi:signal peptidase II